MVFPIVGMLGAAAVAIGGYVLYWYDGLSRTEQAEADRLAIEYASRLYRRGIADLTREQFDHIQELVQQRMAG